MSANPTDRVISVRADERMEAAVERGLVAALLNGVSAGVVVMVEEGVPLSVAARVLLHPEQRRATDWRH